MCTIDSNWRSSASQPCQPASLFPHYCRPPFPLAEYLAHSEDGTILIRRCFCSTHARSIDSPKSYACSYELTSPASLLRSASAMRSTIRSTVVLIMYFSI